MWPRAPTWLTELSRTGGRKVRTRKDWRSRWRVSINFGTAHVNPSRDFMHIGPIVGGSKGCEMNVYGLRA